MFLANSAVTLICRVTTMGVGLISGIFVARYLHPEGKGILATLGVLTGTAIQLSHLGLPSANVHMAAKNRADAPALLANSLWWGLSVGGLIALGVFAAWLAAPDLLDGVNGPILAVALLAVPASLAALLLSNTAIGLELFFFYNILDVAVAVVGVFLNVGLLVLASAGAYELVWLATIGAWVTLGVLVYYLGRRFGFAFRPDVPLLKSSLTYGFHLWLTMLMSFLVLRIDTLVVNSVCGADETGIYSVSVLAIDVLQLIPAAVGTVLFPRLSALDPEARNVAFVRVVQTFWPLLLAVAVVCGVVFSPFVRLLYGEPFVPAVGAFYILLPGTFFLSIQILVVNSLAARGDVRALPWLWAVTTAVNLGLTLLLVPKWGIAGAAWASTIAYTLIFVLMVGWHRHRWPEVSLSDMLVPRRSSFLFLWDETRRTLAALKPGR